MKLSLFIQTGSLAGRTFDLTQGYLTIGRSERCNVRFDPMVERVTSKEHCYIEIKDDGFYLTDNQSTNGTFLNDEKIQSSRLNSGDRIRFGKNGSEAIVQIEMGEAVSQQTRLKQDFQIPLDVPQFQIPTMVQAQQIPLSPLQAHQPDFNVQQATQVYQPPPVNLRNSLSGLGLNNNQFFVQPAPEQSHTKEIS